MQIILFPFILTSLEGGTRLFLFKECYSRIFIVRYKNTYRVLGGVVVVVVQLNVNETSVDCSCLSYDWYSLDLAVGIYFLFLSEYSEYRKTGINQMTLTCLWVQSDLFWDFLSLFWNNNQINSSIPLLTHWICLTLNTFNYLCLLIFVNSWLFWIRHKINILQNKYIS